MIAREHYETLSAAQEHECAGIYETLERDGLADLPDRVDPQDL